MQAGRIFEKGPSWFLRYREPIIKDGKKAWHDVVVCLAPRDARFKTKRSVEHLAEPYLKKVNAAGSVRASTTQTVNDFIEHVYFPNVDKRPSTIHGYKHIFAKQIKSNLDDQRIWDFRPVDGQVLLEKIAKGNPHLAHTTLKHIKHFLTGVFTFAVQRGLRDTNPMRDVAIPKGAESKDTHAYTPEEIVSMIKVLEKTQPIAATVVATAAFTGLRKSELRGLRWMDLEGNQLRIQRTVWNTHIEDKTKTPTSRAPVPLVPMLQKLLESHRNGFPQDGFIFAGQKKKKKQPLNLSNLARRVIAPLLEKDGNGVQWHGWHAFRRGLATNLYAIQTPENVIQDIMRHADVKITRKHYIKMSPESSQRAMDSLEKLFTSLEQKK